MQSIGCRWKFLKYPLEFCNSKSDLLPPDPWLLFEFFAMNLVGCITKHKFDALTLGSLQWIKQ